MFEACPLSSGKKLVIAIALALPLRLLATNVLTQTNLVSDIPGEAAHTDPNLRNSWGVSFAPTSPFWISNQASGTSTLYTGTGNPVSLVVTIPPGGPPSGPTGQVFNTTLTSTTPGFALSNGNPGIFIFDTLNGTIDGWNPAAGTTALQAASTPGAIYTGLALASVGSSSYLYAADSTGSIRVFDSTFTPVTLSGNFTDPSAIAGYVPFNIELIGSNLYVTYAKLSAAGIGLPGGYVDVFTTSGTFVKRLATGGSLYAPWGMAIAPPGFGTFGGNLLVGNFGNGEILRYDPSTGAYLGTLNAANGTPFVNDFLWSLEFRTAGPGINPNALYFTAGINHQTDGLFGEIAFTPEPETTIPLILGILSFAFWKRHRARGK